MILTQFAQGDEVLIFGKPKYEYGRLSFPSAEIEHMSAKRREIVPVYADLNYIPGTWIREKILLLRDYIRDFEDQIPREIREKRRLRRRSESIESIHFPVSIEDFERAKSEIGYEELYHFQKRGLEKKYALQQASE